MNEQEQQSLTLTKPEDVLDLFKDIQLRNLGENITQITDSKFPPNDELKMNEACFFKIKKLAYDKDYPHREAFENVLLSLDNRAYNFVYVLTGNKKGIELYIGVVRNGNNYDESLSAANYGANLKKIFEGNFNGSELEPIRGEGLKNLIRFDPEQHSGLSAGIITGIPSVNDSKNSQNVDFQGIDRLINSVLGLEWRLVVVNEPVDKETIYHLQTNAYDIYNRLAMIAKRTIQHSESHGSSESYGTNSSDTKSKNSGWNESKSNSRGKQSEYTNSGISKTYGTSGGKGESYTTGKSNTKSINDGNSNAVTVEIANKHASEIMKYIDEELLQRLKLGFSKGLFKSSVYYTAKNPADADLLKAGILSLFQGNESSLSPLCAHPLDVATTKKIALLTTYQNHAMPSTSTSEYELVLKGRPFHSGEIELNTFLTAKEISLIAALPQTEVPGITLVEGVGFGLNEKEYKNIDESEFINLGHIVQRERVLDIPFYINKKNMMKHTFIAGVTGSGKTTTCHKLLRESKMNFLVLEPAKTEYRTLIQSELFADSPIVVFTLGNESLAPFRLNPFELVKGEVLSGHIDMIKATFTSAFPMEASMPQILEEAIYNCYKKYGWDIDKNENIKYGEAAYTSEVNAFPILSNLLEEMKNVSETKGFGSELQANYIGSLVSRLSNLTVGSKGSMLNCEHSTNFDYIAKHNVIIEMEDLKSPEDKSLFMGFILSRLAAVIKQAHKTNKNFKHLTLVEEAHRLLSKSEFGDSGSKKVAVETFTDLLAEVRKYGEGLIIVDQIPNKLAPEVLKNTNTKIVHKILAKDDKETVGDTMLMNDKQKEYLSALETGNAIIFTEGTDKPVHVKIDKISDTNEDIIDDERVKERFKEKESELGYCYSERRILTVYKEFEDLCRSCHSTDADNTEARKKFLKRIQKIAEENNKTIETVLQLLIERHDNLNGMKMANFSTYDSKHLSDLFLQYLKENRHADLLTLPYQELSKKLFIGGK